MTEDVVRETVREVRERIRGYLDRKSGISYAKLTELDELLATLEEDTTQEP